MKRTGKESGGSMNREINVGTKIVVSGGKRERERGRGREGTAVWYVTFSAFEKFAVRVLTSLLAGWPGATSPLPRSWSRVDQHALERLHALTPVHRQMLGHTRIRSNTFTHPPTQKVRRYFHVEWLKLSKSKWHRFLTCKNKQITSSGTVNR